MDRALLPLPRWEAELRGDDRDLSHLALNFSGEDWCIYKDPDLAQTLMVLYELPVNAGDSEVFSLASAKARVLSGVLRVARQSRRSLSVGSVMLRQLSGTTRSHATMHVNAGVTVEFHAEVFRRDEHGQLVPVPPTPPISVKLAALAKVDTVVAKVMRLSVTPDAESWTGLYRIAELIEGDDWRTLLEKGWITREQRERFRRTANSPEAGDTSRHGYDAKSQPPPKPMTLGEAREYVEALLRAWLAEKMAT